MLKNESAPVICAAAVCLAAAVWAAVTPPAGSVVEFFETTESNSYIGKSSGSQLKQAQQFYLDPEDTQPVSGIGILLNESDYGSPVGDITLEIYTNASGNIPGEPVPNSSGSLAPVLGTWNYISYDGAGPTLQAGSENKYWIVASVPEQAGNDAYKWQRSTRSSDYDRGYRKTFNLGGTGEWSGAQTGDFAFRIYGDASLAVSYSSCRAVRTAEGVRLSWVTGSEHQTAGFNVLRSLSAAGGYERINPHLIRARGEGSSGAAYAFTDRNVTSGGYRYYKIRELQYDGGITETGPLSVDVTGIGQAPDSFGLVGSYPNPFNPSTLIRYKLSEKAGKGDVSMDVFDARGRKVAVLDLPSRAAGVHETSWNGCDRNGSDVPGGIYICRLQTSAGSAPPLRLVKVK